MTIPIYVGYDEREAIGYSVFCHSVLRRTKSQVAFQPVRGTAVVGSTKFNAGRFSIARQGWAIWAECDMLCRADIADLWALRDDRFDVMVAQHDYRTKYPVKFLGQPNPDYPRKNWSSLMLINGDGEGWKRLAEGREYTLSDLHRFAFVDAHKVGALPLEWNWLVGEYDYNKDAKLAHFTVGLPIWDEYTNGDYADEWYAERGAMLGYQAHLEAAA